MAEFFPIIKVHFDNEKNAVVFFRMLFKESKQMVQIFM